MPKYLLLFFVLALLTGSCAPAASPAPPSAAAVSPTLPPSPAPSATSTSVPQAQDHLIITRDHEHWAVLNADGSLYKYIQIPGFTFSPDSAVSPDGNWLAYEPGSYEEEPYDYALHLLNLDDGTSQFVTNLLSPDFPGNIEPLVKDTFQYDPSLYGEDCADIECRRSLVKEDVALSAGGFNWSPDGQWLAFAAQIDGPSTDLYNYNMQDKTIQRLTDDPANTSVIDWSPNGKWILYANYPPGIYDAGMTFYRMDMEGNSFELSMPVLPVEDGKWLIDGWVSEDHYLFYGRYHEQPYLRRLLILDAESGQVTEVWPYTYESFYVVDVNTHTIVLLFEAKNDPNLPHSGVYRISTTGDYERIGKQMFYHLWASPEILGIGGERVYHITSDNSFELIGPGDSLNHASSPDKNGLRLLRVIMRGVTRLRFITTPISASNPGCSMICCSR